MGSRGLPYKNDGDETPLKVLETRLTGVAHIDFYP